MRTVTKEEIIQLYKDGGFLGEFAPTGDWWLYPADFIPLGDPGWSTKTLAKRIDVELPRQMKAGRELVIEYGDTYAKIWVYRLDQKIPFQGEPVAGPERTQQEYIGL